MNKKQYIQPTTEVFEIQGCNLMVTLSPVTGGGPGKTEAPARRGIPID